MLRTTAVLALASCLCLSFIPNADAAPKHRRAEQHKPLKVLPKIHHSIVHKGKPYFYSGGRFYQHSNGIYLTITAPIGAIIPALAGGYVTFTIGANRYFYQGGIYYRHAPGGYVVVKEPPEAQSVLSSSGSERMIIYPAAGQSDEKKSRDKYECHEWAVGETSFDPTDSNSDPLLRADYHRAMGACLEARDYIVK